MKHVEMQSNYFSPVKTTLSLSHTHTTHTHTHTHTHKVGTNTQAPLQPSFSSMKHLFFSCLTRVFLSRHLAVSAVVQGLLLRRQRELHFTVSREQKIACVFLLALSLSCCFPFFPDALYKQGCIPGPEMLQRLQSLLGMLQKCRAVLTA